MFCLFLCAYIIGEKVEKGSIELCFKAKASLNLNAAAFLIVTLASVSFKKT